MTPLDLPGPKSAAELERLRAVLYPGIGEHLAPFVIERKSGSTLVDLDGNEYVDCASASASVPLGAAREDLIEPMVDALRRYGNEDGHGIASDLAAPLAERLIDITPASLTRVAYALNGTEAIETAVKVMRRATGRPIILGFLGGYHGETTITAALGAEENEISAGLRALVPGFAHVPYPNPYRSPFAPPRPGGSGDATVDYIRDHLLFHAIDPAEVAGVVIEPVLGSGGCVAPSRHLLARAGGALPRARVAALRRRGEDRDGPLRPPLRGRTLGRRTRPDVPRQGARRRRRADRRGARLRARARLLRRRPDRLDLVLAALGLRRGERHARPLRARTGAGERARAGGGRRREALGAGRAPHADRRGPRRSAPSRRSSWSATGRPRSATASCRTRPGPRRCAAASSPTRARPRSTSSPRS